MLKLTKDIFAVNLGLYFNNTLVISDIHIGYEEALNKQGYMIPRYGFEEIIKQMNSLFSELKGKKISRIILNGDLKHEFGKISETEWRHTLKLLDYLSKKCKDIILIKGNHDTILGPIAKKRNIKIQDKVIIKDKVIIHGDKIIDIPKSVKTIIIGHEHPAVALKDSSRVEKYKCFLLGKYEKCSLLVQPSFTPVTEGTDVLKEEILSPYLKKDLKNFKVFIVADKIYDFGKLKNLPS